MPLNLNFQPGEVLNAEDLNSIVTEINTTESDLNSLESNFNSFVTNIFNTVYPINCYYTQYAESDGVFKNIDNPNNLFTGTVWELKFNTSSTFFRTEGNLASESRDSSTGIQGDAVIKMTGVVGEVTKWETESSGVFKTTKTILNKTNSGGAAVFATEFDNSLQVPTSTETRPVNKLIRIWKRTS